MISELRFYLKLMSRRFPAMAALILLSSGIGIIIALRLPTMYQTEATLLVEAAQIPDEMVRASTRVDASEQLQVIQQRLLTRSNLIDIARTNQIFRNQAAMNPDDIVSFMREHTRIRRSTGRNEATLMTIAFSSPNPQKAASVVNQYVTIVLATNSDFRTERAEGTLEFFQQEVRTLSENLDSQSGRIVQFKNENSDALPENLDYRLGRQSLLQERLSRAERDLEALTEQRASIKRIYESTGTIDASALPKTPEQERLRDLEGRLRVALSVYSEVNPKVKLLRNQISMLEEQMQEAARFGAEDSPAPQATALDISLSEIDSNIASLEREIGESETELARLQDNIDRTPANRIALNALEREQENLQDLYSAAIERLAQARMGERIVLSAKGERISVLEPANVPSSPSSPNRPLVAGMGVAVGLGAAAGLFLLLEILNSAIRRPADIVSSLKITPLITLPRFETVADRRRRQIAQVATLALVIVLVPASLWAVDTYYMPLDLLFEKVVDRLS